MQTKQLKTIRSGETFLLSYVVGLLSFAQKNPTFAESLAAAIQKQNWKTGLSSPAKVSQFTTPETLGNAIETTLWALNTLLTHPEYTHTRGLLASWAQGYESPKDLVLGIVGVAIIGPTLGLINSKKKKKKKAQLVIEKNYYQSIPKKELAVLTTSLTQALIAQETKLAGGNVYNLHPDSAAWCIEEAVTAIYTDSTEHIHSLLQSAKEENVSHLTQKDTTGSIQVLVISPSVNDSFVEESDAEVI